jgi:hypothetical protein
VKAASFLAKAAKRLISEISFISKALSYVNMI